MRNDPPRLRRARRALRALSLIEITLVIALMLGLATIITYSVSSLGEWQRGREASEQLKSVYIAQKSYLADHPAASPAAFTEEKLIPYLPGRPGAMPKGHSLNDEPLALNFAVMPPVFMLGGSVYDPSDSDSDGLWDVGGL